jgi:hypothetical protein
MAPPQLRCRDLRGGDIMLQLNSGNLAHRAIAFAQWVAGQQDSHVIHVGIMRGETYMIESEKRGIWAADLANGTFKQNADGSLQRDSEGSLKFKGGKAPKER